MVPFLSTHGKRVSCHAVKKAKHSRVKRRLCSTFAAAILARRMRFRVLSSKLTTLHGLHLRLRIAQSVIDKCYLKVDRTDSDCGPMDVAIDFHYPSLPRDALALHHGALTLGLF